MYCTKCGAQNSDNSTFCTSCGASMNAAAAPEVPAFPGAAAHAAKPANRNKLIGIIAVAAAAVLVIILCMVIFSGRSCKSTVKIFVDASFTADAKDMLKVIPGKMVDYAIEQSDSSKADFTADLEESLESSTDYIEYIYGDDWKYSYKIISIDDVSSRELKSIREDYKDYDINVKAAKTAEIKMKISGDEYSDEASSAVITLIKVGRSWYIDLQNSSSLF